MARDQRRLAAIVSADVVGYSRLMGRDESGTLAELKRHRREVTDPKINEYCGRIVKTTGDGLLIEFPSVVDAVRCAVDTQRMMAERNAGLAADSKVEFRIGINVGDIIIDEDDIFGDGVNVAARLQTLAEPGGICASRAVRDQVVDKLSFAFDDLGTHTVKNIARPVEVYRIRDDPPDGAKSHAVRALPSPHPDHPRNRRPLAIALAVVVVLIASLSVMKVWRTSAPPSAPPLSIAILPFAATENTAGEAQIAALLTRDLTATLSHDRWNTVASQEAAQISAKKNLDVRSLGRDLGVRYVTNGSVNRVGDKLSVTVTLIDTDSGSNAWSDSVELAADSIDRNSAALRLSRRVGTALYNAEMRRAAAHPDSHSAWDVVLRGDVALTSSASGLSGTLAARKLYAEALTIDPNFVPALVSISMTINSELTNDLDLNEARFAKALEELDTTTARAVSIDPNDGSTWYQRSVALQWLGRWDESLAANRRGEALGPQSGTLVANHAYILMGMGKLEEARVMAERAAIMERGILGEEAASMRTLCQIDFLLGHYDKAMSACEMSAARENWWVDQAWLTAGYALLGQTAKAFAAKTELLKQRPRLTIEKYRRTEPALHNATFAQLMEAHFFDGLRKAGVAEK